MIEEEIKLIINDLKKISNCNLPDELMEPFNEFFKFVKTSVETNPKFLDPTKSYNKWYHRYVNGIYLDVRQD